MFTCSHNIFCICLYVKDNTIILAFMWFLQNKYKISNFSWWPSKAEAVVGSLQYSLANLILEIIVAALPSTRLYKKFIFWMSDKVSFLSIAHSNKSINVCQFSCLPSKLFYIYCGKFHKSYHWGTRVKFS